MTGPMEQIMSGMYEPLRQRRDHPPPDRVEALRTARDILPGTARTGDVVMLAEYILEGKDAFLSMAHDLDAFDSDRRARDAVHLAPPPADSVTEIPLRVANVPAPGPWLPVGEPDDTVTVE